MEKYLLTVEFRYNGVPKFEGDSTHRSRIVTIGVYDDIDDACFNGNCFLENLESKFDCHVFPDGRKAPVERFSKNGGCFGGRHTLISETAYIRTPFSFFAKITTLKHDDVDIVIDDVVNSIREYRKYKANTED